MVISYADRLILVRPVSAAVISAFSVWCSASACSLSTAKVTLPGTRSSVTLSSSGAYWCTFSMMVFAVWVGTSGPAEAVAVDHARCSVSVSSLFASVFSHAERYSSLERSYSRCSGGVGCGWNVRTSPPAPFAILFSRLRRCSACPSRVLRSSSRLSVSVLNASRSAPSLSISVRMAARRSSISVMRFLPAKNCRPT